MISATAAAAAPPSPSLAASPDALADLRHNGALQIIHLALKPFVPAQANRQMSARQLAVLMHIAMEQGPHTVGSLAQAGSLWKGIMSRQVAALREGGFVAERANPEHVRAPHLVVTQRGLAVLERLGTLDTGIV
ncbi:MarR family transcriptional regulator [Roseomonas elaeocarpi]|uniref:MarR family transcriptional regulator n=1 Tax=Roseomonas elaeocarpi TaxID=907779 RepID=A0ABV6JZA7_9PROT